MSTIHTLSADDARKLAERIRHFADYTDEFARTGRLTPGHAETLVNLWDCDKLRVISHAKPAGQEEAP